jgi:hypothetical protein
MLGVIIYSAFVMFQNKLSSNNLFCNNNNIFHQDKLDENYRMNTGLCELIKNDDHEELDRIIEHFRNYELLKKLNSSLISVQEKIDIIKMNDILDNCGTNITNGGLLDDWDFIF